MKQLTILGITELPWTKLYYALKKDRTFYAYYESDVLVGVGWTFNSRNDYLNQKVRRKAQWEGEYYKLAVPGEHFLKECQAKFPDWQTVKVKVGLKGCSYSVVNFEGLRALLVPLSLPTCLPPHISDREYLILHTSAGDWVVIPDENVRGEEAIVGFQDEIDEYHKRLALEGAIKLDYDLDFRNAKIKVETRGWTVTLRCDLHDLRHHTLKPPQIHSWDKSASNLFKRYIPWKGVISATRKSWSDWKRRLEDSGLEWEGDNPDNPLARAITVKFEKVPGWDAPAPNGHVLYKYQREGISFCATKGMRVLIGDEMGVGKSAQAIGAALATEAKSILIVCPANARYVWEREIDGWAGTRSIQHLSTGLTDLDPVVRWRIVTYDLLVSRPVSWTLDDAGERALIEGVVGRLNTAGKRAYPLNVSLTKFTDVVPQFASAEKADKWRAAMRRLDNELLKNLVAAGHDLLIVDEAHRVKNEAAKRSQSLQELSERIPKVLLLTGTPMRNHPGEAGVLLGYIDPEAGDALSKKRGYSLEDIKDYLGYYMIRRLKRDVLPQLPEKIRQTIELDILDPESLHLYEDAIACAGKSYCDALGENKSLQDAMQMAYSMIECARSHLGIAKVRGGQVAQVISEIIEAKGRVVVFCAHRGCSDLLKEQLAHEGITAQIVDGRTRPLDRKVIEKKFQDKRLPCFIGGINAAGEAITLTAADTVVFVELDWVPAALLQAEDRIHRVGQERGCHVIHLLAHGDTLDSAMAGALISKLEKINAVLGEDTQVFADSTVGKYAIYAEVMKRLFPRPLYLK